MVQLSKENLIVSTIINVWIIWDHLKRNRLQLVVLIQPQIEKPKNLIRPQINGLKLLIINLPLISESKTNYSPIRKYGTL